MGGASPLARTDGGGLWVCEMSGIWLYTIDQLKAARALEGRMDAGVTKIIVPDRDFHLGPRPEGVAWPIEATVATAALRATEVVLDYTVGAPTIGGEHFSIDHSVAGRRMYRIIEIMSATETQQTVKIRPPLRQSIASPTPVDFDRPGCTMRLSNPDDFFGAIESGGSADLSPVFVEAF